MADCKPVLSALEKMGNQSRVSVYEVDDQNAIPEPGEGTVIRIDKLRWTTMDGVKFTRENVEFPDLAVFRTFQDFDGKGAMQCENLGAATYRGAAVVKYRFNNPNMTREIPPEMLKRRNTTNEQVRKFVMLVDRATGLPAYSESMTTVGFKVANAYVYGDAIKDPSAGKGQR